MVVAIVAVAYLVIGCTATFFLVYKTEKSQTPEFEKLIDKSVIDTTHAIPNNPVAMPWQLARVLTYAFSVAAWPFLVAPYVCFRIMGGNKNEHSG